MNCPYCSNPVADGAAFCGNCGAKMEGQAAPAAPAAPMSDAAPPSEPMAPPADMAPAFTPAAGPVFTPPSMGVPPKKSNRNMIIIALVVGLLLCCCCIALFAVWQTMQYLSTVPYSQGGTFIFGTPTPRLR